MKLGSDVMRNVDIFMNFNNHTVHGSLFGLLNKTVTSFGSRRMRQWISHPLINAEDINDRLLSVCYFRNLVNENHRSTDLHHTIFQVSNGLNKLPDLDQRFDEYYVRQM